MSEPADTRDWQFRWSASTGKDGGGHVVSVRAGARDVHVALASSVPFPPGAPLDGTLEGSGLAFVLKVGGLRRTGDAVWEISGRLVSPRTSVRDAFLALAPAPDPV